MTTTDLQRLVAGLVDEGIQAGSRHDWKTALRNGRAALAADRDSDAARSLVGAAEAMLSPVSVRDEQTQALYLLHPERRMAVLVASLAAIYCLAALLVTAWFLFDTWVGRNFLLDELGYDHASLTSASYRLLAFTTAAGALGAILDALRSLIRWHATLRAFEPRFIWKSILAPLMGGTIGVIIYIMLRAGMGVVTGDFASANAGPAPVMSAFAVAALAGFSWHQVFKWLDCQGDRVFRTSAEADHRESGVEGRPAPKASPNGAVPTQDVGVAGAAGN